MAENNVNQLLSRNIDALSANTPLFVNIESDGFFTEYLSHYPNAHLNCYYSNFSQYNNCDLPPETRLTSHFCAHYQSDKKHDLVVMSFPKSKAEFAFTLAMLAASTTPDALIVIVGENKSGIKSAAKLSKNHLAYCNKNDAARHCLLFAGQFIETLPAFNIEDYYKYYEFQVNQHTVKVAALPGVFSQNSIDVGTEVLLENLPEVITGKVLDFGCGAGIIAAYIGVLNPDTHLTLADVSALALESAQKTLSLNGLRGNCIASNSLSHIKERYDYVISNPPFHQGIKTHYAATEQFLAQISQHITDNGSITIVANSFLQYPPIMEKSIGPTKTVCKKNGFSIYHCDLINH